VTGDLQARLFRAARLVVDTGIHGYNWPCHFLTPWQSDRLRVVVRASEG
jgi:uncharacterized protein (DUF885 family)